MNLSTDKHRATRLLKACFQGQSMNPIRILIWSFLRLGNHIKDLANWIDDRRARDTDPGFQVVVIAMAAHLDRRDGGPKADAPQHCEVRRIKRINLILLGSNEHYISHVAIHRETSDVERL